MDDEIFVQVKSSPIFCVWTQEEEAVVVIDTDIFVEVEFPKIIAITESKEIIVSV